MDAVDWPNLPEAEFVRGRLATEEDVKAGRAVFFIKGDAVPADILVPQYALYPDEDGGDPRPCILIQAEETIDACMVGLRLLDGTNALATLEDVVCLGQEIE